VLALFSSSHFFLFPTTHPGEGHSNALTEAMAMGCVPLAALNGFNHSVMGDCGGVLPQSATSDAYADTVLDIVRSGRWSALSSAARERAHLHFNTNCVVDALIEQYVQLLGEGKCH
jgi:glycosyltransferase involved in cell wall biosynthesis